MGRGEHTREGQKQGQGSCHRLVFVDPRRQCLQRQGACRPAPNDYRNVPLYWNDPLRQAKPAPTTMKFEGSQNYVATPDLMLAVNASMTLRRPLLVKGEPGTGKTMLAEEAAAALGLPLLEWHIKSTTKAQQGLYEYDAV